MFDTFGSRVKIKSSSATVEKGLADKIGKVYGQTTPSMMDFEIIGNPKRDFAVNVFFDDLDAAYWFDEELLETIDNGQSATITLDGIDKKWTKNENGEWVEEDAKTTQPTTERKNWWEFGNEYNSAQHNVYAMRGFGVGIKSNFLI
jgi:hypothetical protein